MRAPGRLCLTFLALSLTAAVAAPAWAVDPTYGIYPAPSPLGTSAGEPSIGVDRKTGKVMFQRRAADAARELRRLRLAGHRHLAGRELTPTSLATLDPILYIDRQTGRTFVSQLAGRDQPDGLQRRRRRHAGPPARAAGITSGVDHQTVGARPLRGRRLAASRRSTRTPSTTARRTSPSPTAPRAWTAA